MSEIKEKLDSLIATDYERELLLKIDDLINVSKLPFLTKVKIGQTKQACRVLMRYDRELREVTLFKRKNALLVPNIKKHFSTLEAVARELHDYINNEIAKGTSFY